MWENQEKKEPRSLTYAKDVQFFVDGECVTPGKAFEVAEETNYMADYVIGKEGRVSEIRFDRIDLE